MASLWLPRTPLRTCVAPRRGDPGSLSLGASSYHVQLAPCCNLISSPFLFLFRLGGKRSGATMAARTVSTSSRPPADSFPLTHDIDLPGQPVESVQIVAAPGISNAEFRSAINSSLFKKWLENMQTETGGLLDGTLSLRRVVIQGVDMFGDLVGFLKFKADVFNKETGIKIPGIVFARGPAVTILILLDSDGETYAVLTEQARVPVGRVILELPAGMLDKSNGDFLGTAIREVEEETGIHLNVEGMVDLTALLYPSTGCRVFPSPGGCDEEMGVFLYRGELGRDLATQLHGKEAGLREHGELIRVRLLPYHQLWRATADAKVLTAIALYEMAQRDGLLPPATQPPP